MNTIIIDGVDRAYAAAQWAREQFKNNWEIKAMESSPFDSRYAFSFPNAKNATVFALKWIE